MSKTKPLQEEYKLLAELANTMGTPLTEEFFSQASSILEEAVAIVLEPLLQENDEFRALTIEAILANILDQYTAGLTMMDKERLRKAAVNLNLDPCDGDPFANYAKKLSELKDIILPKKPSNGTGMEEEIYIPAGEEIIDPQVQHYKAVSDWLFGSRYVEPAEPKKPLPSFNQVLTKAQKQS